jgi:hypothetical protein
MITDPKTNRLFPMPEVERLRNFYYVKRAQVNVEYLDFSRCEHWQRITGSGVLHLENAPAGILAPCPPVIQPIAAPVVDYRHWIAAALPCPVGLGSHS